jgi:hypothetical protein
VGVAAAIAAEVRRKRRRSIFVWGVRIMGEVIVAGSAGRDGRKLKDGN